MYLFLFLTSLIIHLLICKIRLKTFTSPFAVYGIIWFALLTSTQLPIIMFIEFSAYAVLLFYLAYIAFLIPSLNITRARTKRLVDSVVQVNTKRLKKIVFWTTLIFFVLVVVYWVYIIRYFGGLSYIFKNSYDVRHEAMGKQIAPLAVTYSLSIGYVAVGLGAYLFFFEKKSIIKRLVYVIPFVLLFLEDLATFGRVGTIFGAIIYVGTYFIRLGAMTAAQRRKQILKILFLMLVIVVVLLIPKLIRSDGSFGHAYDSITYLPEGGFVRGAFLHLYTYATGPLAAFGNFLDSFDGKHTFGIAQFLPVYNIVNRIMGGILPKYDLLYEFTTVPFETNIYTYLREAYTDFGLFGVILTPLLLGTIVWFCYKVKFRNPFLKIVLLQYVYLYAIYSVFYTPYSQGGVVFGMVLYFIVILLNTKQLYPSKAKLSSKRILINDQLHHSKL